MIAEPAVPISVCHSRVAHFVENGMLAAVVALSGKMQDKVKARVRVSEMRDKAGLLLRAPTRDRAWRMSIPKPTTAFPPAQSADANSGSAHHRSVRSFHATRAGPPSAERHQHVRTGAPTPVTVDEREELLSQDVEAGHLVPLKRDARTCAVRG
jgi:hypothetical protein